MNSLVWRENKSKEFLLQLCSLNQRRFFLNADYIEDVFYDTRGSQIQFLVNFQSIFCIKLQVFLQGQKCIKRRQGRRKCIKKSAYEILNIDYYQQILITEKMQGIEDQFQIWISPEFEESLSESFIEMSEPQVQEVLQNLPTLEQYLSNQYQILNRDQLTLRQLCRFSQAADIEEMKNSMSLYFSKSSSKSYKRIPQRKNRDQTASQFKRNLRDVPFGAIIYISIMEIEGDRCHIIVRSARGEWLAYFEKQRQCKKLQKISLILKQISKPMMVVIIDDSEASQANLPQITKTCNQANQFVYIFQKAEHMHIKIDSNQLRSGNSRSQMQNFHHIRKGEQLMICSPNVFSMIDSQAFHTLIGVSKKHQREDNEALSSVTGQIEAEERDLKFEFIFINVLRTFKCEPGEVILIMNRLFNQKQEQFKAQESMKKQKQTAQAQEKDADSHFPESMGKSNLCEYCKPPKKTKLRCEGCTVTFKRDIALCIACFGDFHQIYLKQEPQANNKLGRRIKRSSKRKNKSSSFKSQISQKMQENDEMIEENIKIQNAVQEKQEPSISKKIQRLGQLVKGNFELIDNLKKSGSVFLPTVLKACIAIGMNRAKLIQEKCPAACTNFTHLAASAAREVQQLHSNPEYFLVGRGHMQSSNPPMKQEPKESQEWVSQ